MKRVLVLHLGQAESTCHVSFLDHEIELRCVGCGGALERTEELIVENDGKVDAIGLEMMPAVLSLGNARRPHEMGVRLKRAALRTPVVDGSGVRAGMERWGVVLADRAQPGIFSEKRILMVPGLNHGGIAAALRRFTKSIRYADPVLYFAMPDFPGIGSHRTVSQFDGRILDQLKDAPFRRLHPQPGKPKVSRATHPFVWADVLAGDVGAIRRYAPEELMHKTVVVGSASQEDLDDLRRRGVSTVVRLIPSYCDRTLCVGQGDATIEAMLVVACSEASAPLSENAYLDLIASIDWEPDVRALQPEEAKVNRFAFVIHPLDVAYIHKHPLFRWTRLLPDPLVESVAAYLPPMYLSRITGAQSPTTGQKVEGHLFTLGATPRQMMTHSERFTYSRLNQTARMAARKGARILGLGAFTSVVGDAGITVAHEAAIAVTSGNSLTVAATLEAAKRAVVRMGATDLTKGKVMVIGATGSIGSVCARLLAQALHDVVLVSIEPEKLIDLKRLILDETPSTKVTIGTKADDLAGECDLIVTATSAFGQRVLDITQCKPGAVVCDVARPPDIHEAEAALRPDVLVIESGEVLIPGSIDFGYDIGLPPKTSYACLAETALLAMEGRFEDYTLGREISTERVKEIYRLFRKHKFELTGERSFGKYLTDEDVQQKRALADRLRADPALLARLKVDAAVKLVLIPAMAKGVRAKQTPFIELLTGPLKLGRSLLARSSPGPSTMRGAVAGHARQEAPRTARERPAVASGRRG